MTKLPFSHTETQLPLLIFLLLSSVPFFVNSQFSPAERATLLNLKQVWDDPPALDSWNATSSPCDWPEIQCSGEGSVTGIFLRNYNLSGSITDSISALANLTVLDLSYNFFPGNFPTAILNCSNLQHLDLSQNLFVGNIPANIDRLESLNYLDLGANNFTGDIPPAIGNLTQLKSLYMYMNLLNGSYPVEISNLANLEHLGLAYNDFRPAVIPPEFGKLRRIKYIWMTHAKVFGEMPESFSNLSSLAHLDLSSNDMEGEIPSGLFLLKNLSKVYLYKNRFSGSIPPVIESLNLVEIDLAMNKLSGEVPEDFGKLKNLELLNLFANELHGELPPSIGLIPALKNFRCFRNNLSGELPSEMGLHSNLEAFEVSDNHFTGNLPENLCAGKTLFGVVAFNNNLTGQIPKSLANCQTLRSVQLYSNSFSGEVPPGLWSAQNITSMMLSDNSFSGQLPSRVAWNLTRLEISNNKFSGEIPSDVSSWANLIVFKASNNIFTGPIPQGLTSLRQIITLVLDGNSLSGEMMREAMKAALAKQRAQSSSRQVSESTSHAPATRQPSSDRAVSSAAPGASSIPPLAATWEPVIELGSENTAQGTPDLSVSAERTPSGLRGTKSLCMPENEETSLASKRSRVREGGFLSSYHPDIPMEDLLLHFDQLRCVEDAQALERLSPEQKHARILFHASQMNVLLAHGFGADEPSRQNEVDRLKKEVNEKSAEVVQLRDYARQLKQAKETSDEKVQMEAQKYREMKSSLESKVRRLEAEKEQTMAVARETTKNMEIECIRAVAHERAKGLYEVLCSPSGQHFLSKYREALINNYPLSMHFASKAASIGVGYFERGVRLYAEKNGYPDPSEVIGYLLDQLGDEIPGWEGNPAEPLDHDWWSRVLEEMLASLNRYASHAPSTVALMDSGHPFVSDPPSASVPALASSGPSEPPIAKDVTPNS